MKVVKCFPSFFSAVPLFVPRDRMKPERYSWLGMIPVVATGIYYSLPDSEQTHLFVQFLPQILAYVVLGIWIYHNDHILQRLGLSGHLLNQGLTIGGVTGIVLGVVNSAVILWIVPALGFSISFLTETPHAQVPTWIMVPWGIVGIACAVELNFRGFLLGRLLCLGENAWVPKSDIEGGGSGVGGFLAVVGSALVFAFDPFMVSTFQHLHWIAVWDGIIWGWLWVRTKNLYVTCMAHAVEVVIVYLTMKFTLM
ncbi:MAG: hypothetical protein O7F12_04135 [Nitrospirae bacterium]|nr:hypothetical protein [Nitrospirota bacterium]